MELCSVTFKQAARTEPESRRLRPSGSKRVCLEREKLQTRNRPPNSRAAGFGSSAGGAFLVALGIDIERPGLALDHVRADDNLLDTVQAWQFEHGFEQDRFHDRAQAARAGAAVDRLLGDDVQRLLLEGELGVFHLEQA